MVKQPFFLLGLEEIETCKGSAFGAMWLFILIFSLSLMFLLIESNIQPTFQIVEHAEDYPMLPRGMTDYHVNTELELSGRMMGSDSREIS